jgi:hypothetical protein
VRAGRSGMVFAELVRASRVLGSAVDIAAQTTSNVTYSTACLLGCSCEEREPKLFAWEDPIL